MDLSLCQFNKGTVSGRLWHSVTSMTCLPVQPVDLERCNILYFKLYERYFWSSNAVSVERWMIAPITLPISNNNNNNNNNKLCYINKLKLYLNSYDMYGFPHGFLNNASLFCSFTRNRSNSNVQWWLNQMKRAHYDQAGGAYYPTCRGCQPAAQEAPQEQLSWCG